MSFLFGSYTATVLRLVGYVSIFFAVAPILWCVCFERQLYSIGIALLCLLMSGFNAVMSFAFAESEEMYPSK